MTDLASLLRARVRGQVSLRHPLAQHTSYKVGGLAELAVAPVDLADLVQTVSVLAQQRVLPTVLGAGCNVLISDRGVRGVVLLTGGLTRIEVQGSRLVAEAGVPSHELALAAQRAGLSGAEFLACLPGSIGGACYMNARAFGGEMSQVLTEVTAVRLDGTVEQLALSPTDFSYKRSPFQSTGSIIARAALTLAPDDGALIGRRMSQIEETRRAKHELDFASCGCVFKNDQRHGMPAGKLIESCGLKGLRLGQAQVSPHHANFIINLGGATASELRSLMELVVQRVLSRTGHRLEPEVQLLGEWPAG